MDKLQMVIKSRPMFHRGETEISRSFDAAESLLSGKQVAQLNNNELTCYGIGEDVLGFIAGSINKDSKTLETGAGCSTLVFACCGADHTAVTPSLPEITLIGGYAADNGIPMERVKFVQQSSDYFLPRNEAEGYDLVLLDGKHAFPWPVIDWFYTADKLKEGGLMLIDDAEMKSVSLLTDFMKVDNGWELVHNFSGKTIVFKKTRRATHDVAWHMQPYTVGNRGPWDRLTKRIRQTMGV